MRYVITYSNGTGAATFVARTAAKAVERARMLESQRYDVRITDPEGRQVDFGNLDFAVWTARIASNR